MKKALGETQTLCAGCSKLEPKIFALPQTPFLGVQDGQNLISWRWSLPSPTDPVWWRSMHTISSYRGNPPTNTHRRPACPLQTCTQTGPITIHCAAKLSTQCNELTTNGGDIAPSCRSCGAVFPWCSVACRRWCRYACGGWAPLLPDDWAVPRPSLSDKPARCSKSPGWDGPSRAPKSPTLLMYIPTHTTMDTSYNSSLQSSNYAF